MQQNQDAARLCSEGLRLLDDRRFAEAEELLQRARALAPDNPHVHYCLAVLFGDLGQPADALAALDASLALDDGNAKTHNNRGSCLHLLGRLSEAERSFHRAIELRPDLAPPYMNLGKTLEGRRRNADAVAVYELAIARGHDPELFGQCRAAALGLATARSPDSWVRATFDSFAPTFDAHLRTLRYDIPRKLADLLAPRLLPAQTILDIGCGTGLVGAAVGGHGHRLEGVDLSERMLAQARTRNVYDALHEGEIHDFLAGAKTAHFDAICAADVFIYIGKLEEVFAQIARVLRAGGWFAFSTEGCVNNEYALLPTGRYAQSEAYIRSLSEQRFSIVESMPTTIRMEFGAPISGRVYLLQKI